MKLYIYDDGRESSIIHFSNNHIHATILKAHRRGKHVLLIISWVLIKKKKGRHQMVKFARCQFLVRLIILELRRKLRREKKRKDFHAKRHTFFEERARASEYTYTQK